MKLELEINNKSKSSIKDTFVKEVVLSALQNSEMDFIQDKNISLSFAWVDENEIKELNRIYRKHDSVTDVLSFCEFKNKKELKDVSAQELFLGELVLCYNYIKEYTVKEKGIEFLDEEFANVISHGVLHLLTFRHGKKMFDIQKEVIKLICQK